MSLVYESRKSVENCCLCRFSNTTGILQKKLCGLLVLRYSKRRVHPLLKKSRIRPCKWYSVRYLSELSSTSQISLFLNIRSRSFKNYPSARRPVLTFEKHPLDFQNFTFNSFPNIFGSWVFVISLPRYGCLWARTVPKILDEFDRAKFVQGWPNRTHALNESHHRVSLFFRQYMAQYFWFIF